MPSLPNAKDYAEADRERIDEFTRLLKGLKTIENEETIRKMIESLHALKRSVTRYELAIDYEASLKRVYRERLFDLKAHQH